MDTRRGIGCCGRCAGPRASTRAARRRSLMTTVFPARPGTPGHHGPPGVTTAARPRALTGTVLDASPHVLVVASRGTEYRLTLPPGAVVWRGSEVSPASLRAGEPVAARVLPGRRDVAAKVWASIGRVTGTITARTGDMLLVDEGKSRQCQCVVIPEAASSRIRVRFPCLEAGNLIDVIGLRRGGVLEALLPASAQPALLAERVKRVPTAASPVIGTFLGSATWHEPAPCEEPDGVAYPSIDPASGCRERVVAGHGNSVLPYLAVGSRLLIRNECSGMSAVLPVISCGAVARLFYDRCLGCDTSPRGRVADLTIDSFVSLGGELETGCFNAAISPGRWP